MGGYFDAVPVAAPVAIPAEAPSASRALLWFSSSSNGTKYMIPPFKTKRRKRAVTALQSATRSIAKMLAPLRDFHDTSEEVREGSTLVVFRRHDMQASTKPTTAAQCDDGAPASEEPAQVKINSQLVDYATPVRTPQ